MSRAMKLPTAPDPRRPIAPPALHKEGFAWRRWLGVAGLLVIGLVALLLLRGGWRWPGSTVAPEQRRPASPLNVALVEGKPNTLFVPDEVRQSLGISKGAGDHLAVARRPTQARALVMPGSTMLDPGRLMRIRARF